MTPRVVWAVLGASLAVVFAAMSWSTRNVLELERAEQAARAQALLEENARLALWRMDSAATALLAREAARPVDDLRGGGTPAEHVLLHFEVDARGRWTSPGGGAADQAARLSALRARPAVAAALRELGASELPPVPLPSPAPPPEPMVAEKLKSNREYAARKQSYELTQQNVMVDRGRGGQVSAEAGESAPPGPGRQPPAAEVGALTPLWAGDALLLARRVRVAGGVVVQGCWLDWPALDRSLRAQVQDLLPGARLDPVGADDPRAQDERRLAALPVRLVPGPLPLPARSASPVRLSLAAAWGAALLAGGCVVLLLRGVLDLSERRRVFVSAVTHELRTPLTTFRLYTDMLADGMVGSEEKRRLYLERLRAEAMRLGHLVENVLFYARVESGRAGAVRERVDLREVVREAVARLCERAASAGLTLEVEAGPPLPARVDRGALEQVIANLVDNACKYAAASEPPVVSFVFQTQGGRALVQVRDHGPGLSDADRRRLFQPFSKSDREAAGSAPGVGLGLALSRRLARAQGGDLRLAVPADGGGGALFELCIPLDRSA